MSRPVSVCLDIDLSQYELVFEWQFSPLKVYDGEYDPAFDRVPTKNVYDDMPGSTGGWYVFFEQVCMDPPKYLICANSWESAYEIFIEEFATVISDSDMKDYYDEETDSYEGCEFTSRGAVNTESIMGYAAQLVSVTRIKGGV